MAMTLDHVDERPLSALERALVFHHAVTHDPSATLMERDGPAYSNAIKHLLGNGWLAIDVEVLPPDIAYNLTEKSCTYMSAASAIPVPKARVEWYVPEVQA